MSQIIKFAIQNQNKQTNPEILSRDPILAAYRLRSIIKENIEKQYIKTTIPVQLSQVCQDEMSTTLLYTACPTNYKFSVTVILHVPSYKISIKGLPWQSFQVLALPSADLRLNFLWFLQQIQKEEKLFSAAINLQNGRFEVRSVNQLNFQSAKRNRIFGFLLRQQIESCINFQCKIVKILKFFHGDDRSNKKYQSLDKFNKKISKFISLSFMQLGISKVYGYQQPFIIQSQVNQRKIFEEKLNQPQESQQIINNLFFFKNLSLKKNTETGVFLTEPEIEEMQGCLAFPKPKMEHTMQNSFIFNKIQVLSPQNIPYSSINIKGSTCKIKLAKLVFCQQEDYQQRQKDYKKFVTKKNIEKLVLIKSPKNKEMSQYIEHQKDVVSSFKYSSSAYMIKYYSTETKPLQGQLIMDFYQNTMNLKQYLDCHSRTMEIKSKIVLLSNIANGLRFLKTKGVVHLDLNANNILVTQNLLTKLIDFGESYQEDKFCPNYKPGFTNPFGPPEIFHQKYFNCKQDIFSLGILFFYIILRKLPFEPTENLIQNFRNKTYHKKFFFAVEGLENIWHEEAISILFSFFNRMIDVNPVQRPYPTWARVIFKYMQLWEQKVYYIL